MNRRSNAFLALAILIFAMLNAGCATDKAVISQAQQFDTQLKPAEMNDPALSDYLQRIGDRIIASARELDRQGFGPATHKKENSEWMFGQNMKFHFVNSKTLNAFTTGGDHLYIYNELFQQCKSEEELAAVMSHEYAHVYSRHVAKGMQRQYTALAAGAGLGGARQLACGQQLGSE